MWGLVTLGRIGIAVPNMRNGSANQFYLGYVLASAPGLLWIIIIANRLHSSQELVSIRRRQLHVLDYSIALLVPLLAGSWVWIYGDAVDKGFVRNVAVLVLACVAGVTVLRSSLALIPPVFYLVASASFGFPQPGSAAEQWAFMLNPWADQDWLVVGALGGVLSAVAFLGRQR